MITSLDGEKASHKIQHTFMIKKKTPQHNPADSCKVKLNLSHEPREMKTCVHTETCMGLFIVVSFSLQTLKTSQIPFSQWLGKLV